MSDKFNEVLAKARNAESIRELGEMHVVVQRDPASGLLMAFGPFRTGHAALSAIDTIRAALEPDAGPPPCEYDIAQLFDPRDGGVIA